MKYKFKAKDIKTRKYVIGDLAYVNQYVYAKTRNSIYSKFKYCKVVPYILTHNANGGMMYITNRYRVDENTIELIKED
jgi:hypothetical protein